jgi:hypothetical protein
MINSQDIVVLLGSLTNSGFYQTLLQVQVALLSATLVFLGFVQVTLSNLVDKPRNSLKSLQEYWSSKVIIRRVRLLIGTSIAGATTSCFGMVTPNIVLGILSGILLLVALIGIGILTFGITNSLLEPTLEHPGNG